MIASGEDVNILVLDTEVYSNTGGQSSRRRLRVPWRSLPPAVSASEEGPRSHRHDLRLRLCGADRDGCRPQSDAQGHPRGRSLSWTFAHCGLFALYRPRLEGRMGKSHYEEELAVKCGYWHLWRYNPELEDQGKNPFMLDSKAPKWEDFQTSSQARCASRHSKSSSPHRLPNSSRLAKRTPSAATKATCA